MEEKINIAMFDFSEEDLKLLENDNYHIYDASVGKKVKIDYGHSDSRICLPSNDIPENLHEYDIIVLNLLDDVIIPYKYKEHEVTNISTGRYYKDIVMEKPIDIFDPKNLSLSELGEKIPSIKGIVPLILVFANESHNIKYKIKSDYHSEYLEFSNYGFLKRINPDKNKFGKKYKVLATKEVELKKLLEEFKNIEYQVTFKEEDSWDNIKKKWVKETQFLPLIVNSDNEIISYLRKYKDLNLFVFPDIKEKGRFTKEFLERIAPKFVPQLFNSTSRFSWINDETYLLPDVISVNNEILLEKQEQERRLNKLEVKLIEKKKEYKFLSDLLTETDEALVDAVFKVLKWIGFEKITEVDSEKEDGVLEEDLLIEYDDKFLVIEVKGIGGTSKDSECSQISKVRHRRMKEKNTIDVSALYIVNHERFKPPLVV